MRQLQVSQLTSNARLLLLHKVMAQPSRLADQIGLCGLSV